MDNFSIVRIDSERGLMVTVNSVKLEIGSNIVQITYDKLRKHLTVNTMATITVTPHTSNSVYINLDDIKSNEFLMDEKTVEVFDIMVNFDQFRFTLSIPHSGLQITKLNDDNDPLWMAPAYSNQMNIK